MRGKRVRIGLRHGTPTAVGKVADVSPVGVEIVTDAGGRHLMFPWSNVTGVEYLDDEPVSAIREPQVGDEVLIRGRVGEGAWDASNQDIEVQLYSVGAAGGRPGDGYYSTWVHRDLIERVTTE